MTLSTQLAKAKLKAVLDHIYISNSEVKQLKLTKLMI
jgi:hypothetical protein